MNVIKNTETVDIWNLKPGEVGHTSDGRYLMIIDIPEKLMPMRERGYTYVVDLETGIVEGVSTFGTNVQVEKVDGSFVVNCKLDVVSTIAIANADTVSTYTIKNCSEKEQTK